MVAGADTYRMARPLCLVPWQGCWECPVFLFLSLFGGSWMVVGFWDYKSRRCQVLLRLTFRTGTVLFLLNSIDGSCSQSQLRCKWGNCTQVWTLGVWFIEGPLGRLTAQVLRILWPCDVSWDLNKYLFIYLASPGFSCSMWEFSCGVWDLVLWPGIKPVPPALGVGSLSQWTTREVLRGLFLNSPNFPVLTISALRAQSLSDSPLDPSKAFTSALNTEAGAE